MVHSAKKFFHEALKSDWVYFSAMSYGKSRLHKKRNDILLLKGGGQDQCDQKKFAKGLYKLPKYDFTRKMIDFEMFTKIA